MDDSRNDPVRIDKWLWAARFFKTRSLAQEAVTLGRVTLQGERMKPSKTVREGEMLTVRRGEEVREVIVKAVSDQRGPASQAALLYEETESSRKLREARKDVLKLASDPAAAIRGGRPTKREGRRLRAFRRGGEELF